MKIINRSEIQEPLVIEIARRSSVADREFVLFLDDAVNATRAEYARTKLEEYRQKNWQFPLPQWHKDATGENDYHACTVHKSTVADQKLPQYVLDAIRGFDVLVYLDATYTKPQGMRFALVLAHESRHAWQYFNAPVVLHSQTALSWVHPPQETPCELDAERAAKRLLSEMHGPDEVRVFIAKELADCAPEHRDVLERLATLDIAADPQFETKTIELLRQHAAEIVKIQRETRVKYPDYVIPGIRELTDALKGKSDVRLLP
jgi:hypothetical protein